MWPFMEHMEERESKNMKRLLYSKLYKVYNVFLIPFSSAVNMLEWSLNFQDNCLSNLGM